MFRNACALVLVLCFSPCAFAQDAAVPPAALDSSSQAILPAPAVAPHFATKRPPLLVPMYVGFAALQAADIHSTTMALSSGAGSEANPLMKGVAGSPAALIAVKAASTAGTIWAAEKLWKKHPVGAIAVMALANGMMAVVVAHNYSVR